MNEKSKMIELEVPPVTETAVLVRLALPNDREEDVEESIAEMARLAWTAGAKIGCTLIQRRAKPCPATLVGKGKAEQILAACEETEADLVIFDSELSPAQGANLEDLFNRKVVDRTQLILDIFAQRARTSEGKHQVELAQLQYLLPRLAGRGSVMRQQGGIGVRGPGEQKLEVDRRVIRDRIARLKHELEEVRKQRQQQRKRRAQTGIPTVALVGYTNAGKSSLLNALTDAGAFVEDKLFATLDPTTRRCALPSGREALFSDTVGFVRQLPHSLVAAFRATLEEVNEADLLLLVADASHPAIDEHVRAVYAVLDEIKAEDKPIQTVLNKCDVAEPAVLRGLAGAYPDAITISARTREGLDALLDAVEERLDSERVRMRLRIPQSEGALIARIHASGRVENLAYEENAVLFDAEMDPSLAALARPFAVED